MLPQMTGRQRYKANALIKRLCANYDGGNCLLLDDGEGGIFHTYQLFLYLFLSNGFERGIFIAEAIFTAAVNILYFSKTIQK